MTTTWWAVLAATLGCFAFKIAGHSVPQSVLDPAPHGRAAGA